MKHYDIDIRSYKLLILDSLYLIEKLNTKILVHEKRNKKLEEIIKLHKDILNQIKEL
jgi:hypothetical protein